jgi:hypothetical protein
MNICTVEFIDQQTFFTVHQKVGDLDFSPMRENLVTRNFMYIIYIYIW